MKKSFAKSIIVTALGIGSLFLCACDLKIDTEPVSSYISEEISEAEAKQEPVLTYDNETDESLYRFRNDKLLTDHYKKHGMDMGFASKEEYEKAAGKVIANPDSLHKTEKEDGDDIYYLEETNEFVVVSTDGYIRTYFYPDSGKKYFDKQ